MKYIRFGELPVSGKSAIWKGEKCIGYEQGISVYEAHQNEKGVWTPVIPMSMTDTTLDDYIYHLKYFRGRKYIVDGTLIGYGSNNEPLIDNIKIIAEIY